LDQKVRWVPWDRFDPFDHLVLWVLSYPWVPWVRFDQFDHLVRWVLSYPWVRFYPSNP